MFQRFQKFTLGIILGVFMFITVCGTMTPLAPAQAQLPATITSDLPRTLAQVLDQIWEGLKAAVLGATARVVAYGLRKVAYDSAVWLASGGKGQTPFAQTKDFTNYLSNVGDQAFSNAIEELGKPFGMNLCKLPDIKMDLTLRVGLRTDFLTAGAGDSSGLDTTKPSCSFQEFSKNWFTGDSWQSKYGNGQLTKDFNQALKFDNNDLGIRLDAKSTIDQKVTEVKTGASLQRAEGQGFLPKTDLIAGNIQTPALLTAEGFKGITPDKTQAQDQATLQSLIAQGNIKVIPNVLGLFLSTLASTMVKNFQEKGILPFGIGCADGSQKCFGDNASSGGGGLADYTSGGFVGGRSAAQQFFQSFLETPLISQNDNYDVVGNLGNCDGDGVYNCRADQGLISAIQQAQGNTPLTIAEAMQNGMLHGDWKLIPPSRVAENADRGFCQRNYCFSNIQVLVSLRVLPLGFEIAALNSDPDRPWSLNDVVKNFDSSTACPYDAVNKPFCHLIDPNWVIKLPQTRCAANVYGPVPLTSGAGDRLQDCADVQNCVAYNSDGSCKSYGYCTREKNFWNLGGQTCSPQFTTCRTYQNPSGQTVSYLYRTLDTGFCSQDTVGCRAYSLHQTNGVWDPVTAPSNANGYAQNGIYFNKNLPSANACSANSAGCTLVDVASSTNGNGGYTQIAVKIAPDYLGCYGTPGSWPETTADLAKLPTSAACASYAAACIPDEQSCNWYSPVYGGTAVPGRYTPATVTGGAIVWNDECPAVCVGYNAYQEMPSSYSAGQPIAYITPPNNINNQSAAKTCRVEAVGCSSFTNLNTTQGGLEQTEYYSYLRPCVTQEQDPGTTYVTYEGSLQGGYQLRSYALVADNVGGPAYFSKDATELAYLQSVCTENLYQSNQADPDCRQFSDNKGTVYYRMLGHTIPVAKQCTPYRLNSPELYVSSVVNTAQECATRFGLWDAGNNQCKLCYQNGRYDANQGACVYYGLPAGIANNAGMSSSCTAAENTCRAYKGNAGNNVKYAYAENFENASALTGWQPTPQATISTESTQVNGHSLGIATQITVEKAIPLDLGSSYEITFWAKGANQQVTAELRDAENGTNRQFGSVTVGDTWQLYRLGPIDLNGFVSTTSYLRFAKSAVGSVFVDNINVLQLSKDSYLYLVKNTLKVDALCDADQTDNLPGQALGCMAYKRGSDNKNVYVTNFSHLCREGAIGCTAVYNTHNTGLEDGPRAYNIQLTGGGGQTVSTKIGIDTYSCTIKPGQTTCYVKEIKNHTASEIIAAVGPSAITASTVYVQPDTPSTTPLYLVANQAGVCSRSDVGCVLAGAQVDTPVGPTFVTTTIKNNPDDANYAGMLCQSEAAGCSAYALDGGTSYFKDPTIAGQKICTYKTDIMKNGSKFSGWFWKGVGVCSNNQNSFCTADADCGGGATCTGRDEQPCYPGYLQNGSDYGLYSYGDAGRYTNFVGECPATENMCTQFIDHNDIDYSVNGSGTPKSYYVINRNLNKGDCGGSVNPKAGCALFDQADVPNKYWSTAETYAQAAATNQSVVPSTPANPATADANIILKAVRDRTCGEWIQCQSSHTVFDQATNKYKSVCDAVGRCDQAADNSKPGDVSACAHWVDPRPFGRQPAPLTVNDYVSRDVSWAGMDYTGMSLLNTYPVDTLVQQNLTNANSSQSTWRLVEPIPCGSNDRNVCPDGPASTACTKVDPTCDVRDVDSNVCVPNIISCGSGNSGQCLNGLCVQTMHGEGTRVLELAPKQTCRAYPEKDSPFPNSTLLNASQMFSHVNQCTEWPGSSSLYSNNSLCECDYTKAAYGDTITKFWNYSRPNQYGDTPNSVPTGLCQGSSRNGLSCSSNDDCYDVKNGNRLVSGTCQLLKKAQKYVGWRGYCLQYDMSRTLNGDPTQHPCIQWYPVDSLDGALDINNQHTEAGYTGTQPYYCLNSNGAVNNGSYISSPVAVSLDANNGQGAEIAEFQTGSRPANAFEQNLSMADIEKITFTVDYAGAEDPPGGTVFEIWPMDPNIQQASYYINTNKNNENDPQGRGYAVTGRYLGSSRDFVLMYGSNVDRSNPANNDVAYVGPSGDVCFPGLRNGQASNAPDACEGVGGNIFTGLKSGQLGSADNAALFKASACQPHSENHGNWHAVVVTFKPDGKLQGYSWAYCDDSPASGIVYYQVRFTLREQCKYIVDAKADYSENKPSAVWTDRMWKANRPFQPAPLYPYDTAATKYGALSITNLSPLTEQVFISPFTAPLALAGNGTCEIGNTLTACKCPALGAYRANGCLYKLKYPLVSYGAPYSCGDNGGQCKRSSPNANDPTQTDLVLTTAGANNLAAGKTVLSELIARPHKEFNFMFSGASWAYSEQSMANMYNVTEDGGSIEKPSAPVVRPVGNCLSSNGCLEVQSEGVSINGENSRDIYLFGSNKKATMRFFAYADPDQMPIRKISVNWGDSISSNVGEFRNHRGTVVSTCTNNRCTGTNAACNSNADCPQSVAYCMAEGAAPNFGQILDRTCDISYFQYDHVYTCTRGQANGWQPDPYQCGGRPDLFPNGCCEYKPGVQVQDNWGWCNGTCGNNSSAGGVGCYDGTWKLNVPSQAQACLNNPLACRDECTNDTGAYTMYNSNNSKIYVAP